MTRSGRQSVVLASAYRVPDPAGTWSRLQRHRADLAGIGAHHVVLYESPTELGRVLVTIGVRSREPLLQILRSPAVFDWFDASDVEDIPAIFAGEVVEKITVAETGTLPPGVIVAAFTSSGDVPRLVRRIHDALDRLARTGVRKIWVYQAFDDKREIFVIQEMAGEDNARNWIDHPDEIADWMFGTGRGAYPPLFVGRLMHVMSIDNEH